MHEPAITQDIIDEARAAAAGRGARKVTDVFLAMTPAAGSITQGSIESSFSVLTRDDDLLEGAALHIERRPVAATCLECSDEFSTDAPQPICPQCGSQQVSLDPGVPGVQLTDVGITSED